MHSRFITSLLLISFSKLCFGASHTINLKTKKLYKKPAIDLVYKDKRIDDTEVIKLFKSGEDISTLNPYESDLFKNKKLSPIESYNRRFNRIKEVDFIDYKASPTEYFRAFVNSNGERLLIEGSLENHANILRAITLRLLGYQVDVPVYKKELIINFKNSKRRDAFIEELGSKTLTKRDRWIIKKDDKKLKLRGFSIVPANLQNVNVYLPLMSKERQKSRRVYRGLLALYTWIDFPQNVNKISWSNGKRFNNRLILNHPYASAFSNTSYWDFKWFLSRIGQLKEIELEKALIISGYPEEIVPLIKEKLIARYNYFSKLFNTPQMRKEDTKLTTSKITNGTIYNGDFKDYVVNFIEQKPESPFRFSEIFRLIRTQATFSVLSKLLDTAISDFVPNINISDATERIQEKITQARSNNNGSIPLGMYTSPLAQGKIFSSRNIVFGQYLSSNANIQLVDSIGAEVNLGVMSQLQGLPTNVIPNIQANASISRIYSHVRAMPDLKTASKQKIKKLLVPLLMKKLGKIIDNEYKCEIPNDLYIEETTVSGSVIITIKYNKELDNGRELAKAKRTKLLQENPNQSIFIYPFDREKECTRDITSRSDDDIDNFLKEFATDELFIISDTIKLSGLIQGNLPLSVPGLSFSLGSDHSIGVLRNVSIRVKEEALEITVQQQRNLENSISEGINFYIEVIKNTDSLLKGKLYSKVYDLPLKGISQDQKTKTLKSLREIFVRQSHNNLKNNFNPTHLDHDVSVYKNTFKFLFFKRDRVKMNHHLKVTIPNKEGQNLSKKIRTRTFYQSLDYKRNGTDILGLINQTFSFITNGYFQLGGSSPDPGQSFLGKSKKLYVSTEIETTKTQKMNETTKVEFIWSGWKVGLRRLFKYLKKVESKFDLVSNTNHIDTNVFNGSSKFQSFNIRTTIVIYPTATKKLLYYLNHPNKNITLLYLREMFGPNKWDRYCEEMIEERQCIPPSVKYVLKFRNKIDKERTSYAKQINKIYTRIFKYFDNATSLYQLGDKNFFVSSRLTGFLADHPTGYLSYISNSVGTYDTTLGTGPIDNLASFLGISNYELSALSYTPGM